MVERTNGFHQHGKGRAEATRRRYFAIHVAVQALCALLFVTGGILTLMRDATSAASWVYLAGSLAFTTGPIIRLLHERAHRRFQKLPMTPDRIQAMRHPMVRSRRQGTASGLTGGKARVSGGHDTR
ncbi:hypothetical protein GCM10011505_31040 [Tistrella bauzanensis]|uniref:YrhK domain-containing protein n=1 Tax=Tistrella bauzanensis TaxID=657419 RepID=A0ABQ1IMT3_9PROT|nr:YrhK family protein [Tistrella bauzanensis]GGB47728.1 hypothetical protein GCM10011505_31040 [Tistrella bauzanensis]